MLFLSIPLAHAPTRFLTAERLSMRLLLFVKLCEPARESAAIDVDPENNEIEPGVIVEYRYLFLRVIAASFLRVNLLP